MSDASLSFCECGCGSAVPHGRHYKRGHHNRGRVGADHPGWKGGRGLQSGYVRVSCPGHPRASSNGYVFEHVLVAEAALGHFLPSTAVVHHVDENKARNVGGNLVVCEDNAYHQLLHRRQRALDACGDANALRCHICHTYERQSEVVTLEGLSAGKPYRQTFHRDCAAARTRDAKLKRSRQHEGRRSA